MKSVIGLIIATTWPVAAADLVSTSAPLRWVPYSPALAQLAHELGLDHSVVGITQWAVATVEPAPPIVGDAWAVDVEMMVRARPDLVVLQGAPVQGLEAVRRWRPNLRIETVPLERLADIPRAARRLAELVGGPWNEAAVTEFEHALAATRAAVPSGVRVVFLVGGERPLAAGPGTYLGDMIEHVGGMNVAGTLPGRMSWRVVDLEHLAAARPDVLIAHDSEPGPAAQLATRWADRIHRLGAPRPRAHGVSDPAWIRPSLAVARILPQLQRMIQDASVRDRDPGTRDRRRPDAGEDRKSLRGHPATASP